MNKRGETLLEVLIALTLVTVSAAAAASAITSANKGISLSKNYLIAQNLASEGLEIVKNIRDTNWMKFPINKDVCWLNLNLTALTSSECNPIVYYGDGANNDYYISLDISDKNKRTLTYGGQETMTSGPTINDFYGLKLNSSGADENKYTPINIDEIANFYRGIRILGKSDELENQTIDVQVIVKWFEGSVPYTITGTEILTNYL